MHMDWQKSYHSLVHPEAFTDADLESLFSSVKDNQLGDYNLASLKSELSSWRGDSLDRFSRLIDSEGQLDTIQKLIECTTPFASVMGACLQNLCSPDYFENQLQLKLLGIFANDMGINAPGSSRFDEFKILLKRFKANDITSSKFDSSIDSTALDITFKLPSILLALTKKSDIYWAELLGFDYAMRMCSIFPPWQVLSQKYNTTINWTRLDMSLGIDNGNDRELMATIISAYSPQQTKSEIIRGAFLALTLLKELETTIFTILQDSKCPWAKFENILKSRSREASIYHKKVKLGQCPLAHRFDASSFDAKALAKDLHESKFIVRGNSSNSHLVKSIKDPKGKMFRIFTPSELETIEQWIESSPPTHAPIVSQSETNTKEISPIFGKLCSQAPTDDQVTLDGFNVRNSYLNLMSRTISEQSNLFAKNFVAAWLKHARSKYSEDNSALPKKWRHKTAENWILSQHDNRNENPDSVTPQSKAELIESTLQLAPLILIDGVWLRGFSNTTYAPTRIGNGLFQTYWDELGNGSIDINHPKIYRDLLLEMGIDLPPTGAREFAFEKRFKDESFLLPNFWLCLGMLPSTFTPEILGLNLAIELSGVGEGYIHASKALRKYGFSTQFVDLHNSIDNVGEGHSAWAATAVDQYMNECSKSNDFEYIDRTWNRIKLGYFSLSVRLPLSANAGYSISNRLKKILNLRKVASV
jgi:Iron-containing redox enzyme